MSLYSSAPATELCKALRCAPHITEFEVLLLLKASMRTLAQHNCKHMMHELLVLQPSTLLYVHAYLRDTVEVLNALNHQGNSYW